MTSVQKTCAEVPVPGDHYGPAVVEKPTTEERLDRLEQTVDQIAGKVELAELLIRHQLTIVGCGHHKRVGRCRCGWESRPDADVDDVALQHAFHVQSVEDRATDVA